ncbi:hypothetical protein IW140_005036 [Coemansia sp. RSA 1813]|nr:hypothetical protein EV178_005013 [Coemansia sp. RSA 1646]KAJ1769653.1 hypothetical protein LPJ74_003853 [Coemansia sp. RSA 1843]KAJ2087294.1 hypothetical protein IW138_005074 [Coemansia sp. RSA 986]KAJ2212155.1 hypothetical protein EV179_004891 [Coemansia sp. RSA 487]KAJ2566168.1 hypothetical protein IW140_005036 [Coemansia sp. RSA 1813]
MSWLKRNLFSRKRTGSQAKDDEKTAQSAPEIHTKPANTDHINSEKATLHRATLTYDVEAESGSESESEPETGQDHLEVGKESVDDLFARLSVAEVRQYEKTLQSHVDKIQRRMRRVATKHYHDLINAADSVVSMDASSVNISMKLTDLKSMLDDALAANSKGTVVQNAALAPADAHEDPQTAVYAAAAQIKVLIDTPEQIWKALEARHFLQAALLYMIACKIHQKLSAEHRASTPSSGRRSEFGDVQTKANPLPAFPVVERQWAAIASFREQITAKAHQLLETADGVSVEANASAICAIALLEDVDAEMACTLFLTRRGQSLAPLLERIGAFSGESADLPVLLQELLGRVWQVLADFVIIFGVPDDEADPVRWQATANSGTHRQQHQQQQQYASWMLTTLASLSADSDLPVSPSLQPLWQDRTAARNSGIAYDEKRTAVANDAPESADSETPKAPPRRLRPGRSGSSSSIRARRRKSSIAGSVLSSTLTVSPLSESFHFDTLRSPITPTEKTWSSRPQSMVGGSTPSDWVGAHALSDTQKPWQLSAQPGSRTSGMFIISKYLPEEIAQYRPPLARILDSEAVHSDATMLDEAAEDENNGETGLERFLDNPRTLLKVLATQIQPRLDYTAAEALRLWWASIADNICAAATRAVKQRVLSVAEAAQIGSVMHKWESANTRIWLRGFSLVAVGANAVLSGVMADGGSLYESLIEPLLRSRAKMLLCAAMDRTLSGVDSFVQSATESDVVAGALPWRPLPLDGGSRPLELAADAEVSTALAMDELVEDIRGAVNAEPLAASTFKHGIIAGLQEPWRDGERWWMQISGQAAFAEAMECSRHFVHKWREMAERLDQWAVSSTADARKTLTDIESASIASGLHGGADVPAEVLLCIKGAWAATALADVAHALSNDGTPALVRECWQQLDITPSVLSATLQATGRALLEPWLQFLGTAMALTWAAEFDTLYYMIPHNLRADVAATRSDVVEAWTTASQNTGQTAWATRYSALRRISATMAAEAAGERRASTPSTAVRGLAIAHRMRVQAVAGGLGVLGRGGGGSSSSANLQQRSVTRAFARTMCAVVDARQPSPDAASSGPEWDISQLSTDVDFALQQLGQSVSPPPSAHEAGCSLLEAPCYRRLADMAR